MIGGMSNLIDYLEGIGLFVNDTIIPLLFTVALAFFLYNLARYFIFASSSPDREKAKQHAIYGISAFVVLISFWGMVTFLTKGLELQRSYPICPDYITSTGKDCNNGYTDELGGEFGGATIPNETSNNGWSTRRSGEFGN